MNTPVVSSYYQRGVMLFEALTSILIFSIGILAIVGLQVNSIKLASDAKYRADASFLANQYIGEMSLAQSSPTFVADFSSPVGSGIAGTKYLAWWTSSVQVTLPVSGASAPTVTIAQSVVAVASTVSSSVTIDIFWNVPGKNTGGASSHKYHTQTQISN